MSNLGGYQMITTFSKKIGGPGKFLFATACVGYIVLRTGEATVKMIAKKVKIYSQEKAIKNVKEYTIKKSGKSNEGVQFLAGDKIRVLEQDGDAVLIEKVGESNGPYFVPAKLLSEISEFEY